MSFFKIPKQGSYAVSNVFSSKRKISASIVSALLKTTKNPRPRNLGWRDVPVDASFQEDRIRDRTYQNGKSSSEPEFDFNLIIYCS
jgi:glutamate synthase domain-containing protein 1